MFVPVWESGVSVVKSTRHLFEAFLIKLFYGLSYICKRNMEKAWARQHADRKTKRPADNGS